MFSPDCQTSYPKGIFGFPLDIPMHYQGNFGELRPNVFMLVLILNTTARGLKVYAVADGYVSKIKISTLWKRKAIYITHLTGIQFIVI
jgi:hypothetical protein